MKGSVTVFLTLMFSCMMIFLTVFLRMAKIRLAHASGEELLRVSGNSMLTEYDRELFQDYRLFFLPEQAGGDALWETKLMEYLMDDLMLKDDWSKQFGNLNRMKVNYAEVLSKTYATNHGNEAVKHQIYQWMQYEVADTFLEYVLKELSITKTDQKVLGELGEDVKEVQEKSTYNQDMLKVLMYVEGIQTNDTGFNYDKKGRLMSADSFAKIICTDKVNASNLSVGHSSIWEAVKELYWNPLDFIDKWEKEVSTQLGKGDGEGSNARMDWKGIPTKEANEWLDRIERVIKNTTDALAILGFLKGEGLSKKDSICDIPKIMVVLESNRSILEKAMTLKEVYKIQGKGGLHKLKEYFQLQRKEFQKYDVKNLAFDYSSLKLDENTQNPFEDIERMLKGGILDLVLMEDSEVSNKSLKEADARLLLRCEKEDQNAWNAKEVNDIVKGGEGKPILGFLDSFIHQTKTGDLPQNIGKDVYKNLLMNEYVYLYLKGLEEDGGQDVKETALDYEREYIIFGQKEDKENLYSVVNRLILIRTGMNLLHIATDTEKRETTYAIAASLVGFTCMEALVRLTQIALMVGWAWEEAVIDTAALLQGYAVPFIKTKENFKIKFTEVPLFNRKLIAAKVEAYKGKKKEFGNLEYRDYMKWFLFSLSNVKKTCRIMDVVQENMILRYREDFNFDSCLYGLKIKAEFETNETQFEKEWECAY